MEKKMNNEELQSRREFFKKAAKGALPILAAVVLASAPNMMNAAVHSPSGCSNSCVTSCSGGCDGSCLGGCNRGCTGSCQGYCLGGCYHSSK